MLLKAFFRSAIMLSFFKKIVSQSSSAKELQNFIASNEKAAEEITKKKQVEENYMYSTTLINSLDVEELSYDEYMQIDKLYQKN
jgi:hypothetical protein